MHETLQSKITNNEQAVHCMQQVINNVEKIIVGKRYAVSLVMATLACRGHVLIEDVPRPGWSCQPPAHLR